MRIRNDSSLLTTGTLAREADLSAQSIVRLVDSGEILALQASDGTRLISRVEADRFLQSRAERQRSKRSAP